MGEGKPKYPYREAILSDQGGDLSKTWTVNYYVWSERKNQLVRKRTEFNQPTKKERYQQAKELIAIINEALTTGGFVDEIVVPQTELSKTTTIEKAIEFFLNAKRQTASENTIKGYVKDLKVFGDWAESVGLHHTQIQKFGTKQVYLFSDFLDSKVKTDKAGNPTKKVGYSKKTYSNFIGTLRTMWTMFTAREILTVNPFLKITKRKGRSGQHIPYSPEQIRQYKKVCLEKLGDEQLWLFVNFIYYGFFRPAEEGQNLQIKHILKKTIVVPGELAKNNLTEHVRIPKPFEAIIEKYKLRSYPPNYYIFTLSGKPGPKPVGNKYMYMHNRKVLEKANLTDQDYDLYGWKHTGVIALYQATKDIKLVQAQCRHKDINTTDKYLRDLGLFLDEDALDLFPELAFEKQKEPV